MSDTYKIAVWTLIGVPTYHLLLILFGAPWFSESLETLALAVLLSLLTVFPIAFATKTRYDPTIQLIFDLAPTNATEFVATRLALGTIVGTWLGAFAIPLDWDRWWQVWPLPCVFGAIVGAVIGLITVALEYMLAPNFRYCVPRSSLNRQKAY